MSGGCDPTRRDVLGAVLAMASAPTALWAQAQGEVAANEAASAATGEAPKYGVTLGEATPFSRETVIEAARSLAASPYAPPPEISAEWRDLTYDQTREIWFESLNALYRGTDSPVAAEMFVASLYQTAEVQINAVEGGQSRPLVFELRLFATTDRFPQLPETGTGYAGFRLTHQAEEPGQYQEFAVWQGASYFRAVGRGQVYGLSARGIALRTASANGAEEFPMFRSFWIERPAAGAPEAVVHALLDGPSLTGAYTFRITEGATTEMVVEAVLFPRVALDEVGLAAQTSMFLFNDLNRLRFDDFREGVHDSDGLLVANGAGEHLWRPLSNPVAGVEVSSFSDSNPRGFGLMQRARDPASYGDFEAHYEARPSLWVEPLEDWGKGRVMLVEIAADKEIYDNIVCFWRPEAPIAAGAETRFSYRLYWGDGAPPVEGEVARILATRTGERVFEEGRIFTVDYEQHPALGDDPAMLEARVTASAGELRHVQVKPNPVTGGIRMAATLILPEDAPTELRAELWRGGARVGEVWLYRWVPK
jgi:glucans biosynthesis protein